MYPQRHPRPGARVFYGYAFFILFHTRNRRVVRFGFQPRDTCKISTDALGVYILAAN